MLWTTVANSFEIPGWGCWIRPSQSDVDFRIREKDPIQLRTPEGRILNTYIGCIERAYGPAGIHLALGLPRSLTKIDVPEGTEIWLVQHQT